MHPIDIIKRFYPEDTPLRRLLIKHSIQVRDKALSILDNPACAPLPLDRELVDAGAMLHDIGIVKCHAPSILCMGREPYIAHGIIGAAMLRESFPELEPCARICERHTGTGLTAIEIREAKLPIPEKDYLPESMEEKLICLADKFFSKSGDMKEKTPEHIRNSMRKYGKNTIQRFDEMCSLFCLDC